ALPAEERTGDAPGRVHPLLDVDRQRAEAELLLGLLGSGRGRQQHRLVVHVGAGAARGQLAHPAGLEADRPLAGGAVLQNRRRLVHALLGRLGLGQSDSLLLARLTASSWSAVRKGRPSIEAPGGLVARGPLPRTGGTPSADT